MRGIGMMTQELPEWKKHVTGGAKASYGKKTQMTILEQRQSLPIYKLKDELVKVCTRFIHHHRRTVANVYASFTLSRLWGRGYELVKPVLRSSLATWSHSLHLCGESEVG